MKGTDERSALIARLAVQVMNAFASSPARTDTTPNYVRIAADILAYAEQAVREGY